MRVLSKAHAIFVRFPSKAYAIFMHSLGKALVIFVCISGETLVIFVKISSGAYAIPSEAHAIFMQISNLTHVDFKRGAC